jgi:excisionase family DNA binding protein
MANPGPNRVDRQGTAVDGYARISVILAEFAAEGLYVPHYDTPRRWVHEGRVRATRVGAGRFLVNRDDMRRMCSPTQVGA